MNKTEKVANNKRPDKFRTLTVNDVGLAGVQKKRVATSFSTWIRVLSQNWRQGTVACKGRSDVNRSNKKPWKQKGTGRARAGSARSPLWRGGGIIFGPQARIRSLSVPRQLKKTVLRNILIDYIEQGKVVVADWAISGDKPSASKAYNFLKEAGLNKEKIIMFLPWDDKIAQASFANIPNVSVICFDYPDAYSLTNGAKVLVLKKDLQRFKDMVSKWS